MLGQAGGNARDLPWLDAHAGRTTQELIRLAGTYRADSLVAAFEAALLEKETRARNATVTWPERVVIAVESLEREVNCDGYAALFANHAERVPDLVPALRAIGADRVAELTASAVGVLNIDGPISAEAVEKAMQEDDEERDRKLADHDDAYYRTAPDLALPLLRYIEANAHEIVLH